jgi:prevent-host-death family protein
MEKLDVFTVRDLRERTGELLRDAENGKMSLITKHGRPSILAVPFDERLLEFGVHRALALQLFEAKAVSLSQAAKVAMLSIEDFLSLLREANIDAVDYPAEEAAEEMRVPL